MEDIVTADRIEATADVLVIYVRDQSYRLPWSACSSRLADADASQRQQAELSPGGYGIHWPLIDEDLSISGLLRTVGG